MWETGQSSGSRGQGDWSPLRGSTTLPAEQKSVLFKKPYIFIYTYSSTTNLHYQYCEFTVLCYLIVKAFLFIYLILC